MQAYESENRFQSLSKGVHVYMSGVRFPNGEMTTDWYNGQQIIGWLTIQTDHLHSIEANAFAHRAFQELLSLIINITKGSLEIHDAAFNGLSSIGKLQVQANQLLMPLQLFDFAIDTVRHILCKVWPNDINLNEMFANQRFRRLSTIFIDRLAWPQDKFRILDASNFTAMPRLEKLILNDCGLIAIDEHAFDVVGRTLNTVLLENNRIKAITVDMFRLLFETKWLAVVDIRSNTPSMCTCKTMDVELIQYTATTDTRLGCRRTSFVNSCGRYQKLVTQKLCVQAPAHQSNLRFVQIRMTRLNAAILLRTHFSSKFRLLFIDSQRMRAKCNDRAMSQNFKCFVVSNMLNRFDLIDIGKIAAAEFVLITAIPMLYRFGACPFHLITLHQPKSPLSILQWIAANEWLLFVMVSCALSGIFIGLIAVISYRLMRTYEEIHDSVYQPTYTDTMNDYSTPQAYYISNDEQYQSDDESDTYREIYDGCYLEVIY